MILAFDTYYWDSKAKTVCLAFNDWTETDNYQVHTEILDNIAEYQSGEFYKRELPCILSLLRPFDLSTIDVILIDGFVFLDDDHKPGLGAHLYKSLGNRIPVIGIAKTNFATIDTNKRPLLRGESRKPLFITAVGMDLDEATRCIAQMSGEYRLPALLKKLDGLTKEKD